MIEPLLAELRALVQQINLKSQINAAPVGRSNPSSDDEIGGKRPPGGIHRGDDWSLEAVDYWMKSADYFQRRLERILTRYHEDAHERLIRELITEAEETLKRWSRSPVGGKRPDSQEDPKFEIFVAYSDEHAGTLARWYDCSPDKIRRIRRKWRDAG